MFAPYYILAVGFGVFAVIVSVIGIKDRSGSFPGKLYGPIMLIGVVLAVATFSFAWSGGEQEVDHRNHAEAAAAAEGEALPVDPDPLP